MLFVIFISFKCYFHFLKQASEIYDLKIFFVRINSKNGGRLKEFESCLISSFFAW